MGNSKLNICLLLIVAGTATVLGSSAKQKLPQISTKSQEDERLPLNLNDYKNKVENGTAKDNNPVIEGVIGLAGAATQKLFYAKRTVTISVKNYSGRRWQVLGVYFNSGTTDDVLPPTVGAGKTLEYRAYKRIPSAYGVSGVIAYYIPSLDMTLAIMFKVPNLAQHFRKSLWNVELQERKVFPNKVMYNRLYKKKLTADSNWHPVPDVPSIRGSMTKSDTAALQIEVSLP